MKHVALAAIAMIILFGSDVSTARTEGDTTASPLARVLFANGPAKEYRDELMLFGQFVGSWDIVFTETIPGEPVTTHTAEWHFGWILGGRGIQDVIVPGGKNPANEFGTTLRFYDSAVKGWQVYWAGPVDGRYTRLVAHEVDGKIVQQGEFKPGVPMRWIFYDISDNHFQWRNDLSFDGGETWITVQHIEGTRTAPASVLSQKFGEDGSNSFLSQARRADEA